MLSNEQLNFFGLKNSTEETNINDWIKDRIGFVLGSDGRGGTGIFLEIKPNEIALLTARHVLIHALLTGEITVGTSENNTKSIEASSVWIHNCLDAALIYLPKDFKCAGFLSRTEWDLLPTNGLLNQPIIAAGNVGKWKENISTQHRTILKQKILYYWSFVKSCNDFSDYISCDIDGTNSILPKTFKGMSGGPVFLCPQKRLVGVLIGEYPHPSIGKVTEIRFLPLHLLTNLFVPFEHPDKDIKDFIGQSGFYKFPAKLSDNASLTINVSVLFDFYRSMSFPDRDYGRIGRIRGIIIENGKGSERYPINVESIFSIYDDSDKSRFQELRTETFMIVQDFMNPQYSNTL